MNIENFIRTVLKIAPTIASVIANPIGGGISTLSQLIGSIGLDDTKNKIQNMPISSIIDLENKLKLELEMRKIDIEELKIKHEKDILKHEESKIVINDRKDARNYFGRNKEVVRFGMVIAIIGILTIVFFTYKSLFIEDKNLHFVREVKSFIEGSTVTIIMQYFFGSAHRGDTR
jgi:hypothetical protein